MAPSFYRQVLFPWLAELPAERAHELSLWGLTAASPGLRAFPPAFPTVLRQQVWGLPFALPLGLAAGFDKNAQVISPMLALGFGFVEVGTITPKPRVGHEQPRLARLPAEDAILNRMGLNNDGLLVIAERLLRYRRAKRRVTHGLVGASIGWAPGTPGMAETEAQRGAAQRGSLREALSMLWPCADYLTLNISCPNLAGGPQFEAESVSFAREFGALLGALRSEAKELTRRHGTSVPLLLKLSPDLSDEALERLIDQALAAEIDGFVAVNTTVKHPHALDPAASDNSIRGGLSGPALAGRARAVVRRLFQRTEGRLPIIGVGGVRSAHDAYRLIRSGASLVALYTGLVYEGPLLPRRIHRDLAALLHRDGFTSIADAVGVDLRYRPRFVSRPPNPADSDRS